MSSHVILSGSHRTHPAGSDPVGKPAENEIIYITLVLARRAEAPEPAASRLSHHELAANYGADPADIAAVELFASEHGFSIVNVNAAARTITISGRLGDLAAAFSADLELTRVNGRVIRTRKGDLHIPEMPIGPERIIAVLGFDQRPAATTDLRFRPNAAQPISYTPPQIAEIYNFPKNTGKNQTIALIELGGGFRTSDLKKYWQQLGIANVSTIAVSVDGAQNSPSGDPDSADGEVVLDIEVAGGIAPGANIAVYFAPNTDQGFLDAINAAIHDTTRKPSVISISWGAAEKEWTPQAMNAFNAAFHDAALLGITVCAASGDNGSSDGETDNRDHVDFPASSPWVLGCGGTRLIAKNGKIQSETVWNDGTNGGATGGGVSSHFSKPAYQANIAVPKPTGTVNPTGRGVPDVAGVADPDTGFIILVDGQEGVIGGTSAVAPLWAGLVALLNEQLGKNLGWFHPELYGTLSQHQALHDIVSGTNGDFKAAPGWDPCTGLGSPNGQAMLNVLKPSSTN
ncbi:MAG: S8 family serine peptidase [Acidobacteriaceae bacterium]|nr:S8 family serine peptidase [Acidobacteriaceae bacterium]